MKLLDKAIVKALESALESRRSEREDKVIRRREVEKPYPAFDMHNVEHEVIYQWTSTEEDTGPTVAMLAEIQHKQNIPDNAGLEIYSRDGFGNVMQYTIKFTWEDPNNIKKEGK